ncbi:hypothetical protein DD238_004905 [Peronospora effusa]|uniref:ubiquitinyl hydrolase 1 n=1 Tax=Peronospora effusa TaxID=542832 RepID=A0A3M6VEU4_9STRA|nr:hypothetical protein DD238_004905 [Peronospora effusa]
MTEEVYHERQIFYRCGLHALNNTPSSCTNRFHIDLGPIFTKSSLDDTCTELTTRIDQTGNNGLLHWVWNPHKAPMGLGNYDINLLTLALQQKGDPCKKTRGDLEKWRLWAEQQVFVATGLGYEMQWIDKRLSVDEKLIPFDEVEGVLCNVIMTTTFSSLWMQRHWFAIRKIQGVCYNLDSKLPAPVPFEGETECYQFLQELVKTGECELFVIMKENKETTTTLLAE